MMKIVSPGDPRMDLSGTARSPTSRAGWRGGWLLWLALGILVLAGLGGLGWSGTGTDGWLGRNRMAAGNSGAVPVTPPESPANTTVAPATSP